MKGEKRQQDELYVELSQRLREFSMGCAIKKVLLTDIQTETLEQSLLNLFSNILFFSSILLFLLLFCLLTSSTLFTYSFISLSLNRLSTHTCFFSLVILERGFCPWK